eukprot:comp12747_c0_seq1/m.7861 comp12747_c0_seq1/g.7861  ORF comp12747_c0_seq1/g.7861 comp12747_c0_seq1/m.7861 type:complete len:202 (-) comp12747_c0_seq1:398-1003(-)
MATMNENVSPAVMPRVAKEVKKLMASKLEGIKIEINDQDMTDIQAVIDGPVGTPYEGGRFRVRLSLGNDFPTAPPSGTFLTKIFHPNVSAAGEICVNTLKKDWKPTLGLEHIFLTVRCLLIDPNPESALNEEAGKLLLEDYDGYAKHARLMTSIHATPRAVGATQSKGMEGNAEGKTEGVQKTLVKKVSNADKGKKAAKRL